MVKVKKEVWEEVCDFCGETKANVCVICGKDLCSIHTLGLTRGRTSEDCIGWTFYLTDHSVISGFCPDHLGLTLTDKYNDSCKGSKIK